MEYNNMKRLFIPVVMTICGGFVLSALSFGNEGASNEVIQVDESYYSNRDNPVILDFKKVRSTGQLDDILEEYIRENFDGYTIKGRMFSSDEGKFIIALALKDDDGKRALVYFDVTEAYKKLDSSRDKATKREMKLRKSRHLDE